MSTHSRFASAFLAASLAAVYLAWGFPASAQLPSTGAESSNLMACFYECKPGPEVDGQPTFSEITTLMIVNNGRETESADVFFFDGRENAVAGTKVELSPSDLDELQVCATIQSITGAQPPQAGLIQIVHRTAFEQQRPSGIFSWVKNVGGEFSSRNPEPFDGRVVSIGKTECKYVPVPEVNDPGNVLEMTSNARAGDAILVEDTDDRPENELPDLLPIPDANGFFCQRRDGNLIVTVRNDGVGPAGPSTTTVDVPGFGAQSQPTPMLAPGMDTMLSFPIPSGCFNPDCDFRINVDSGSVVPESNEGNNVVSDLCLG